MKFSVYLTLVFSLISTSVFAQTKSTLLGYNTSGDVYEISPTTGELSLKAREQIHSFSLGAIARKNNVLYYISAPAGGSENSIFVADTKGGVISHVDLDLSDTDDDAVALFFDAAKLYGLFSNTSTGTLKLYQINPSTGSTVLKRDMSTLNLEPVAGSISRIGKFHYFLGKPSSNGERRQLVRLRVKSPIVKIVEVEIQGADPTPALCDRIKLIRRSLKFLCVASTTATQVDIYRLATSGKAVAVDTIPGIERIAGGHTMVTPDERSFYLFAYAPGDTNNQRLLKISAAGKVNSNVPVNTIIVGARFGVEEPEEK